MDKERVLTKLQAQVLDSFATIQAELECLIRETERAREAIRKKGDGEHDRRQ